jgi:ectoine hydroxylase-related dioxygenase (phytanoyl-CoA dioxygenase family)
MLTGDMAESSVLTNQRGAAYGARNLLRLWPSVIDLLRANSLAETITTLLGPRAGIVRGLYFDKPPGATWSLPWHRDLTVAVKQHGVIGRFKKPTTKAGVPHMEAPRDLLARMVTARLHLDAMTARNGPLQVIPASHRINDSHEFDAPACEPVQLHCYAGDVLLMRPLLSHASIQSEPDCLEHRRIVHIEFAPEPELPDDYQWHDYLPLRERK